TTDTFDAGQHLNLAGAEKASAWFGKILAEQSGVSDRRSDPAMASRWEEKIAFYGKMKASQEKQLEETGTVKSFR
ncbi:MAG: SGNH/GDSL hydrolase family protein, partial [Firmicutes bacterium]|nr:SGNH/GDSL hydrolase family protein [Bacillota bacterium]